MHILKTWWGSLALFFILLAIGNETEFFNENFFYVSLTAIVFFYSFFMCMRQHNKNMAERKRKASESTDHSQGVGFFQSFKDGQAKRDMSDPRNQSFQCMNCGNRMWSSGNGRFSRPMESCGGVKRECVPIRTN